MNAARLFLLVLVLVASGCASGVKMKIEGVDWTRRIGTYSYAQAVADLGEPRALWESSQGKTAEWTVSQSPQMSFGIGVGGGSYGRRSGGGVGVGTSVTPRPRGEYLELYFDRQDRLREWRTVKY
jgi:hypothetical protein